MVCTDSNMELVCLVPPRQTKSAYAILRQNHWVARPWHLEGRYGSRTHRHDEDGRMAIPLLLSSGECSEISQICSAVEEEAELMSQEDDDETKRESSRSSNGVPGVASAISSAVSQRLPPPDSELQELLNREDVSVIFKPATPAANIPRDETPDATIHPERRKRRRRRQHENNGEAISNASSSFTFAELFAGIGGFGIALEALGGRCVFASEIDADCRRIYESNMSATNVSSSSSSGNSPLLHGDICAVPDDDIPTHDLLVAGFPCQPFSSLGAQEGLEEDRGLLYRQIVRVLKLRQPHAFLLENVPGLLHTDNGRAMQTILSDLSHAGYNVSYEVCNARCLTAQSRKRLLFVGFQRKRRDHPAVAACKEEDDDASALFQFPYIPDLQLRACDVINYHQGGIGDASARLLSLLTLTDSQMDQLLSRRRWKPAHLAWPNVVCSTLDSHYGVTVGKGNSQLVPQSASSMICTSNNSSNPRRLSPRECARLMGFPASFRLPDVVPVQPAAATSAFATLPSTRLKQQYRMLGNAVCPPLVAALVGAIWEQCPTTCIRLQQCHARTNDDDEGWEEFGRATAVRLANECCHSFAVTSK